ncbi:TPA: hypothetical protein ACH3X3_006432 [Trebouxia sp. C0006]
MWGANWHLAECAVTTPACRGRYFRVREEDRYEGWRDQDHEWPRIIPWAPFDDDGQYCEWKTDRMMSHHYLDMLSNPQHEEDDLTARSEMSKHIAITMFKEAITALQGTACAAAKQQLAHLMFTSGSQEQMPVPVHSDTIVNELRYYIMLQSLPRKPGWTKDFVVHKQTAQSRYTALCLTEDFRRIRSTRTAIAWTFDEWFSKAPAHVTIRWMMIATP